MESKSWLIDGARRDAAGLIRYAIAMGYQGETISGARKHLLRLGVRTQPTHDETARPISALN